MHEELFRFMGATVTTWKIIGYAGVLMFLDVGSFNSGHRIVLASRSCHVCSGG